MLLAISRTCCTSAFSACSRQPRRWTPFVRYFTYSLHFCLPSHIILCVRKVKQTRQIAVNSNSLVVEILRDVVNHEKKRCETFTLIAICRISTTSRGTVFKHRWLVLCPFLSVFFVYPPALHAHFTSCTRM